MGKTRLQRHLNKQKKMASRLKALAKRALSINDEARFNQVGRQLLWTRQDIRRWEQYLLSLEILEARRDQVRASSDLIEAIKGVEYSQIKFKVLQNETNKPSILGSPQISAADNEVVILNPEWLEIKELRNEP